MTDASAADPALDARLVTAHRAADAAALSRLYEAAAGRQRDRAAAGFFLTQAWVFALEAGDGREAALDRRLARMGRQQV